MFEPEPSRTEELLSAHDRRMAEGDFSNARIASNELVAYAIGDNDPERARRHLTQTLTALRRWSDLPFEFEIPENEWLYENVEVVCRAVCNATYLIRRASQHSTREDYNGNVSSLSSRKSLLMPFCRAMRTPTPQ